MLKLVIDIGNSFIKAGVFNNNLLINVLAPSNDLNRLISDVVSNHGRPHSCLISSVREKPHHGIKTLESAGLQKIISFSIHLKFPIQINYLTPETLGSDRIANMCASIALFPDANILVIDIGTCIKYDFISNKGHYVGGGISPGLLMRYKSLKMFTGQLPEYKPIDVFPELIGQSTEASIRSGVEHGILAEVEGIILKYKALHHPIQVILTGGDFQRFEDKLKSPIFVAPNLTLNGLKVILDANE